MGSFEPPRIALTVPSGTAAGLNAGGGIQATPPA